MKLFPTLEEIGFSTGTDKSSRFHNYLEFYHGLLSPIRHTPITLLEVGVLGGESIRMWSEFFTHENARIFGVDIHDRELTGFDPRVQILIGDATQPNFIHDLTQITGELDVVVDDASHFSGQQKDTLRLLWPHLKKSGLFIIEDTHCSYHHPWTEPTEESFVTYMLEWIHRLNEHGAGMCGVPTETDINQITFRKSVVVIEKR